MERSGSPFWPTTCHPALRFFFGRREKIYDVHVLGPILGFVLVLDLFWFWNCFAFGVLFFTFVSSLMILKGVLECLVVWFEDFSWVLFAGCLPMKSFCWPHQKTHFLRMSK